MALGRREVAIAKQVERSGHHDERAANLVGNGGRETADDSEFFLLEEVRAGAGQLVERIGEKELLAAKTVDEEPDNQTGDGVDEADGRGFDVLIHIDGTGMEMDVLIEPEEIEEISEKNDSESREERIAEGSLKNRDGHKNVKLAIVAIGGGSSEGENDVDEDGNRGEIDESLVGPCFVNEEPAQQREMAEKAGAHEGEEKRGDGSPDAGEQFVCGHEGNNDKEIKATKDEFLQARVLEVRNTPVSEREPHRNQPGQAGKRIGGSVRQM